MFWNLKKTCICAAVTLLAAAGAVLFDSCGSKGMSRTDEGIVWHTTYRIIYDSEVALTDSIIEVMNRVEKSLSPFSGSSLISRINRNETDEVDSLISRAFAVSKAVAQASSGRFDPTVAPLVSLWGFGTDTDARRRAEEEGDDFLVPDELVDSALTIVGIGDCSVISGRMVKKSPATSFNFSAVTKGLGCDEVAAMLSRNGVKNYMVEIGGEIVAAGVNPDGRKWQIQIDAPVAGVGRDDAPVHQKLTLVEISDCGMATSGNYRNFHDTKAYGRFGHTIDPVSGHPALTNVVSATVIAPDAATADALATACMVSGDSAAVAAVRSFNGAECLLLVADGDSLKLVKSAGFPL